MSVFTFTAEMLSDLSYQLDDQDIANDILLIDGDVGAEKLIRGVSADSIKKYARRSKRITRPLAATESTGQQLVEEQLDKYCFEDKNPLCRLTVKIPVITDELMAVVLALNISDQVTIQVPRMGLDEDFWIDDISGDLTSQYAEVELGLVEVG